MAEARTAIDSPCVRVCVIDVSSGSCRGCRRTLDEISFWVRYANEERREVMHHLEARRAAACAANPLIPTGVTRCRYPPPPPAS